MSLIRWICSRLLDQVIPCPQVTGDIYILLPSPSLRCRPYASGGCPCPSVAAVAPVGGMASRGRLLPLRVPCNRPSPRAATYELLPLWAVAPAGTLQPVAPAC
ncbi:hypothetical protein GW17_00029319 [Ensete ventricosum]|nr:hypothetical protein GW17_00029319 [Ensete ventricosum]